MEEMKNTIIIQTVKEQVNENNELIGYLLNGTMHVPGNAPGNKEYELIKQWLAEGNIPEPEFTDEELNQQELNKRKQEANQYLVDTAWYIERLADPSSGKAVPEDVLAKRAEAREILNELKGI